MRLGALAAGDHDGTAALRRPARPPRTPVCVKLDH
jgi:hypothetical protein